MAGGGRACVRGGRVPATLWFWGVGRADDVHRRRGQLCAHPVGQAVRPGSLVKGSSVSTPPTRSRVALACSWMAALRAQRRRALAALGSGEETAATPQHLTCHHTAHRPIYTTQAKKVARQSCLSHLTARSSAACCRQWVMRGRKCRAPSTPPRARTWSQPTESYAWRFPQRRPWVRQQVKKNSPLFSASPVAGS